MSGLSLPTAAEFEARRARLGFQPVRRAPAKPMGVVEAIIADVKIADEPAVRAASPALTYSGKPRDFIHVRGGHDYTSTDRGPDPIDAEKYKVILLEVATKHGLTVDNMLSRTRSRSHVDARQEACFRLVTETDMSFPAIARRMRYGDHTTALHGARKHAERIGVALARRSVPDAEREQRDIEIVRMARAGMSSEDIASRFGMKRRRITEIVRRMATTRLS
jgi:hypothetical protein